MRTKSLAELAKDCPEVKPLSMEHLSSFIKELNSPANIKLMKKEPTVIGALVNGAFVPLGDPEEVAYQVLYGKI